MLMAAEQLAKQAVPRLDEVQQNRMVKAAVRADCEVVINVGEALMPDIVDSLRRTGMRVALWFPDAVSSMGRQLMLLAPYHALFFKDPHIVETLQANLDIPVFYLPQACNPRWHRPLVPAGTEQHLAIAGNMYPSRVKLLERLMARGIPIVIYGGHPPRWLGASPVRSAHTGRYIVREEKARIFRSAAGVLNTMHPAEVAGVNSRLFEAAGSGAAVLSDFRPTIPDLFEIDKEVLVYHDFDELLGQATRLLNEAGLTQAIGDAAWVRAHSDHTYDQRVTVIMERLR
jgi:spore maturation protein CgeB